MGNGRRPGALVLIAAAIAATTSAARAQTMPDGLVVEVDRAHPAYLARYAVKIVRPADRIELLYRVRPQATAAANQAAADRLMRLLRRALPDFTITPVASATAPFMSEFPMNGFFGEFARADAPHPLDDDGLRAVLARVALLGNEPEFAAPAAFEPQLAALGHGFDDCNAFVTAAAAAARRTAEETAQTLGAPIGTPTIGDLESAEALIDRGPPIADALCSPDAHQLRAARFVPPLSVSVAVTRTIDIAQPLTFSADRAPSRTAGDVAMLSDDGYRGPRARVRSPGAVMTVEGHAPVVRATTAVVYADRWSGHRPFSERDDWFAGIRRRLNDAGVPDAEIAFDRAGTQGLEVIVQVRATAIDARILDAFAGGDENERRGVQAVAYGRCDVPPGAIAAAVGDAAARASRLARLLGTAVDATHPLAVVLGRPSFDACAQATTLPANPAAIPHHLSGTLPLAAAPGDDAFVYATFPLHAVALAGDVHAAPARDVDWGVARGGAAPPVSYPAATVTGNAQLVTTLAPQRMRFSLRYTPDPRSPSRRIDPALAQEFAAVLGASEQHYSAASLPTGAPYAGDAAPESLTLTALIPYERQAAERQVEQVLAIGYRTGYVDVNILPLRDRCGDDADALALEAIRGAANAAHASRGARLVAIDVRGPFTLEGACGAAPPAAPFWDGRDLRFGYVRLAAAARVSYAQETPR